MSILKVARLGHPVLRTPARRLEASEIEAPAIQQLIDDMFETTFEEWCRAASISVFGHWTVWGARSR